MHIFNSNNRKSLGRYLPLFLLMLTVFAGYGCSHTLRLNDPIAAPNVDTKKYPKILITVDEALDNSKIAKKAANDATYLNDDFGDILGIGPIPIIPIHWVNTVHNNLYQISRKEFVWRAASVEVSKAGMAAVLAQDINAEERFEMRLRLRKMTLTGKKTFIPLVVVSGIFANKVARSEIHVILDCEILPPGRKQSFWNNKVDINKKELSLPGATVDADEIIIYTNILSGAVREAVRQCIQKSGLKDAVTKDAEARYVAAMKQATEHETAGDALSALKAYAKAMTVAFVNEQHNEIEKNIIRVYRGARKKPPIPEEAHRYYTQATTALDERQFAEAAALYANALEIAPWWPEGHFNRAVILGETNEYEEAVREMKKYLLLKPEAKDARAAQDKIYEWGGKAAQ